MDVRWRAWRRMVLALSVLLVVGTLGLWVASSLLFVRTADLINGRARFDVGLFDGGVQVEHYAQPVQWIAVTRGVKWDPGWPRLWFDWSKGAFGSGGAGVVFVPLWVPVVVCAGLLWVAWRWARRAGRGVCPACGYSLAGLRGGVCPECGGVLGSSCGVAGGCE